MKKKTLLRNALLICALLLLVGAVALAALLLPRTLAPTGGELQPDATDASATALPAAPAGAPQAYLVVTVGGMMYEPIPLTGNNRYSVKQGDEKVNVIEVTPTSIRMLQSTCDNQDCVLQGEVTLENRASRVLQHMILCLPHDVVLELYSADEIAAMLADAAAEEDAHE